MLCRRVLIQILCTIVWYLFADATNEARPTFTTKPKFPTLPKFPTVPKLTAIPKLPRMPKIPKLPRVPLATGPEFKRQLGAKFTTVPHFTDPSTMTRKLQQCEVDFTVAINAYVGMAYYSTIALLSNTGATYRYVCDTQETALRCMRANTTCNNGCEWNVQNNRCEQMWSTAAMWYIEPEPSSPLALTARTNGYCNTFDESTCNNAGCEWKPTEKKCDLGGTFVTLMCNEEFAPLLGVVAKCGAITTADSCATEGADCEWKDNKCEVRLLRFAMLAYGNNAGEEFYNKQLAVTPYTCHEDDELCHEIQQAQCYGKPQDSCTGECEFKGSSCDFSMEHIVDKCNQHTPSTEMTCGEVKELYRQNACCGMPDKAFLTRTMEYRRLESIPEKDDEALLHRIDEEMKKAMAKGGDEALKLAKQIRAAIEH